MRKKILSIILFLCLFSCSIYSQERYVSCQIVETKDSIYIVPNKNYLKGTDYWKWVIYGQNKKPYKFETIDKAISHLGKFGWKNTREYTKDDKHIIIMSREYSNYLEYKNE